MIIFIIGAISDIEKAVADKLFRENHVFFYNISLKIVKSETDAEEAIAQSFLKILKKIEKISSLPCPERVPYCVIIVKNTSKDLLRSRRRTVSFEENEDSDLDNILIDDRREAKIMLSTALLQLSEEERYLINLHFAGEKSYKEIAAIWGISEEAAKKRGQRILRKLRILMEGGEVDGGHI